MRKKLKLQSDWTSLKMTPKCYYCRSFWQLISFLGSPVVDSIGLTFTILNLIPCCVSRDHWVSLKHGPDQTGVGRILLKHGLCWTDWKIQWIPQYLNCTLGFFWLLPKMTNQQIQIYCLSWSHSPLGDVLVINDSSLAAVYEHLHIKVNSSLQNCWLLHDENW